MSTGTIPLPRTGAVPLGSRGIRGARRWGALIILALAQLVVVLDGTIVNIALPQAQLALGLTDGQRQWVVTAYALAFGALLLLGGRIADYWGRKRTYMVGMIGFGAASVFGGLAQNGTELIAARGLQGVFAALLAPAALALLTVSFPGGKERNTAFAVFGTVAGTGAAVGLLLGGMLTEFADWRWCLLVNVVFVLAGVIGGFLFLRESRADGENRYDLAGALTVTAGLGSLVYGFSLAEYGWARLDTIGFVVLGVALLVAFVVIESRVAQPLLPLRVITDRVRGGAMLLQAISGSAMIGGTVYLAFHLQIVLGFTPLVAGVASLPMTIVIMLCAPVLTRLLPVIGPRPMMIVGPLIAAAGLLYLSRITPGGDYFVEVLPGLVLLGLGMANLFIPMQNLALARVAPQDAGVASAAANSAMQIGGSIGLSVFTAFYAAAVATVDVTDGPSQLAAFTAGYSATFLAAAVVMAAGSVVAFFMIRGTREHLLPSGDGGPAVHLG